jgi:hypothetical protein
MGQKTFPMKREETIELLKDIARDTSDRHLQIQALKALRAMEQEELTAEPDPFAALDELAPRRKR